MQLGLPEMLPSGLHDMERVSQHREPLFRLPHGAVGLDQYGQHGRPSQPCVAVALFGQRPAPKERPKRFPMEKSLRHRKGQGCLRPLMDGMDLPTAVMEPERKSQGETEAKRV